MSQNGNIYQHLAEGGTLTKAECFSRGWGLSLNSRCAEIRRLTGEQIDCRRVEINGKPAWEYSMPVRIAYG